MILPFVIHPIIFRGGKEYKDYGKNRFKIGNKLAQHVRRPGLNCCFLLFFVDLFDCRLTEKSFDSIIFIDKIADKENDNYEREETGMANDHGEQIRICTGDCSGEGDYLRPCDWRSGSDYISEAGPESPA